MNIQPGTQTRRKKVQRSKSSSYDAGALSSFMAMFLKAACIFGIVGAGFYFYNSMNAQIAATAREYAKVKVEIAGCENEIARLRNYAESLQNHSYIKHQIARYRLPLVEVHASRQARLHILTPQQAARVAYRFPQPRQVSVNNRTQRFHR